MIAEKFNTGEKIISGVNFSKPAAVSFTNSKAAADLLEGALNKNKNYGEGILVHADVDFDGIASAYLIHWAASHRIGRYGVNVCINKERRHGITSNVVKLINSMNCNGTKRTGLLVVVDSSSNELDLIKMCNCDVIIIDHHEITCENFESCGKTAGGQYVIVNNRIDNIKDMSGAQVVYEWLRDNGWETALEAEKLFSWVSVSLFSDVIDVDNERNQWYVQQLVDKHNIEDTLERMFKSVFSGAIFSKTDIQFSLVPVINAAIRLGHSTDVLQYILNKPDNLGELYIYKEKQSNLVDSILSDEERKERCIEFSDFTLFNITGADELKGFEGLIATKLQDLTRKTCLVYSENEEVNGIKGSFRVCGVMSKFELRKELHALEGVTAEGHDEAFGFTCNGGDTAVSVMISTLTALMEKHRADISGSSSGKNDEYTIQVDTKEQMLDLMKNFEISMMGMINARMTTTKKALIKVPNIPQNVKVIGSDGKTITLDVLGLSATSFKVPRENYGYIYLYPENNRFLTVYVDGVRA